MNWRQTVAELLKELEGQLCMFVVQIEAREYGYHDTHHLVSDSKDMAILMAAEAFGPGRRMTVHDVYPV